MRAGILALVMMCVAGTPSAAELYRWVDQEGNVNYSDRPPPPQAREAQRKRLGDRGSDGPVSYALQQALKNFPVTVYVASDCGEGCKRALDYLNHRGVPFAQKDARQEANANALMALTGGKLEVPVATVGSTTLRGFEENAWRVALDAAGYPSSSPRPTAQAAAAPLQPAPAAPEPAAAPTPESPAESRY